MNKQIEIKLVDPDFKDSPLYASYDSDCIFREEPIHPQLFKHECKNILKEAKKANITTEEMLNAIVAEMYKRNSYNITIDIDGREKYYEPAKEMTLSDIEAALGHKVKIINETAKWQKGNERDYENY